MSFRISIFFVALLAFLIASCSPEHSKIVIAEYNDAKISMDEFEKAYSKNVGGLEAAKAVSYTHLRAHETVLDLVCRLLLEKKKIFIHNYITHMLASEQTITITS